MKKTSILLYIISLTVNIIAQNNELNTVDFSKANQLFKSYIAKNYKPLDKPTGEITSTYPNGKPRNRTYYIQETQTTAYKIQGKDQRISILYHPNGQISFYTHFTGTMKTDEEVQCYESGNVKQRKFYHNNELSGEFLTFYESGKLSSFKIYANGKQMGDYWSYYENGTIKEYASYQNGEPIGSSIQYYENGIPKFKGGFQNGKPVGEWVWYNQDGSIKEKENKGSGIKETTNNANASVTSTESNSADEIFTVVEQMPSYIGGEIEKNKFIASNIRYPEEARNLGIQGTVFLKVIVEKDGSITNVEVLKGVGKGSYGKTLEDEAIRIIKLMPNWSAGKQGGKAVRTYYNLPISFKLR